MDGEDNIYVAGKESDNGHVLSKEGQFVCILGHYQTRLYEGGQGEKALFCGQYEEICQGL